MVLRDQLVRRYLTDQSKVAQTSSFAKFYNLRLEIPEFTHGSNAGSLLTVEKWKINFFPMLSRLVYWLHETGVPSPECQLAQPLAVFQNLFA